MSKKCRGTELYCFAPTDPHTVFFRYPKTNVVDGGPGRIATGARLRLLSVAGCRRISDAGVIRIGLSLSASLREFDISGTSATEAGLIQMTGASGSGGGGGEQRIGREIRLQKISLPMYGREISAAGLSAITGSMTELTSLNLEGCNSPGVTSQGLAGDI